MHYQFGLAYGKYIVKSCGSSCDCMTKSIIKHVLWSCPKITQVWIKFIRLLVLIHANCGITWGAVRWGILEGQLLLHEKEDIVEAFHTVPPYVQMVMSFLFDRLQKKDDIIWKTISSIPNVGDLEGAMYISF